jgi:hypothetical protein
MRITSGQLRQIIREELIRESDYYDLDDTRSGYESQLELPSTIIWREGPPDHLWVNSKLERLESIFGRNLAPYAKDFEDMLEGVDVDPDVVSIYAHKNGESKITRATMSLLVQKMHEMQ